MNNSDEQSDQHHNDEDADFFNLRYVNRSVHSTVWPAFNQRKFTRRKHMLSRRVFQCLLAISKYAFLKNCVAEVIISHERVWGTYRVAGRAMRYSVPLLRQLE